MSTTSVRTRPSPLLGLVVGVIVALLAGRALVAPSAAQEEPAPTAPAPAPSAEGAQATVNDVLLVGDSIMKSTGPALADQLGAPLAGPQRGGQRLRPAHARVVPVAERTSPRR